MYGMTNKKAHEKLVGFGRLTLPPSIIQDTCSCSGWLPKSYGNGIPRTQYERHQSAERRPRTDSIERSNLRVLGPR